MLSTVLSNFEIFCLKWIWGGWMAPSVPFQYFKYVLNDFMAELILENLEKKIALSRTSKKNTFFF